MFRRGCAGSVLVEVVEVTVFAQPSLTRGRQSMRYAMSATWWPERFTVSDDAGRARFEVRNSPGFATKLVLTVTGGEEAAEIRRRRGGRFQVIVWSEEAGLVRRRAADRYEIQGAPGPLAVAGNVADGQDAITGGGAVKATVSRRLADVVRGRRVSAWISATRMTPWCCWPRCWRSRRCTVSVVRPGSTRAVCWICSTRFTGSGSGRHDRWPNDLWSLSVQRDRAAGRRRTRASCSRRLSEDGHQ